MTATLAAEVPASDSATLRLNVLKGPFLNGVLPQSNPVNPGAWRCVPAFENLRFTNALGLTFVPGTSNLAVWEREGRIYSFTNSPAASTKTLMLDIHDRCQGWDDSGLLSIAFHPGFRTNHYLFVYYTWVTPGTVFGSPTSRPPEYKAGAYHDRLSRFVVDETGQASGSSELVLIDQSGDSVWHNGGGLFFHPQNGFLYYADGDDRRAPAQTIDQDLFSGVFRIDVDQRGGNISHPIIRQPPHGRTSHYYIPNDNPFSGRPGVLEEFFALGLRNPYRMTIDPATRRIFIGDVGMDQREEINVIEPADPPGLNFQWNKLEGGGGDLTPPFLGTSRPPLFDYDHGDGQAVVGGFVYRGSRFAQSLGGRYIFGDNVQGKIWMLDESQKPPHKTLLAILPAGDGPSSGSNYIGLSSFGIDSSNELYICQMSSVGGRIFQLSPLESPPPPPQEFPQLLSATGAFADTQRLQPAAGAVPYDVISSLASDGASKQRWMALPSGSPIATAKGEWRFPAGTVFIKHFEMPGNRSANGLPRRIETRLLVVGTNGGVFGATYRWRTNNSDAELLADMRDEKIAVKTSRGIEFQTWHYPSRTECLLCHNSDAGGVLGVKAAQINRDFAHPETGLADNQLRSWNHAGLFSPSYDEKEIPKLKRLVNPQDPGSALEDRVHSYLDANCSHCHRSSNGPWDARFDTPFAKANLINSPASLDFGIEGAKIVKPGDPERSILFYRLSNLGVTKMPPVAKNSVDDVAVALVAEWIKGLPLAENPPAW